MKIIFATALLLSLFSAAAQNHDKACENFGKVSHIMQERHFKPKPIDDSLSVFVFETIMDELDNNHTLFLKDEFELLAKHKLSLDDHIKNRDCAFFTDFIAAYKKALGRNRDHIEAIAKENLVLNTKDTIVYSKEAFPYQEKEERIKHFLRKRIVREILEDVSKLSQNKDSLKPHLEKLGSVSKNKVIDAFLCRANALLSPPEGFENSIYNRFFSTFCAYFDPHSTYFNYNQKASFISNIATENYSLGLYVGQNEKDEVIVEEIVPGGPAYKTMKIDKGDQLIKLAANDQEYTVSCASMETISDIVYSDSYRTVSLTLRKKDGSIYTVSLEKKIMKADDHSVYSFVLGGDNPVGYIKIPSFYTELDNNSPKGCADDVAKEILKLKKENIKGLIIDLQFNGGGSMDEVIRLAGMFIDFGPLAAIADKNKSPIVIKDYNRGTLYNGPMVVLVNGFSASASEFFAGVMQDYNRALIAGSTTLGKATMQTILPLEGSNEEFVKVTIDKFYRVTGKSSQYTGIVPDVAMPGFFDKLMPRESSMPMAIKNDSITFNTRFKSLPAGAIKRAGELSRQRIAANPDYSNIQTVNSRIEKIYLSDKAPLPLNFDSIFDDVHSMDAIWKDINTATEKEQEIQVENTSYSNDVLAYDDFLKNLNEYKIKSVKADPNILESINIIYDLTNHKSQ